METEDEHIEESIQHGVMEFSAKHRDVNLKVIEAQDLVLLKTVFVDFELYTFTTNIQGGQHRHCKRSSHRSKKNIC
jgi:hypothetical protein